MSVPFHDISIALYAQTLPAVLAVLDKGEAHFAAAGIDLETIADFALAADMKPFRFQIQSVVHHSRGALEALRTGHFAPPPPTPPWRWPDLRRVLREAGEAVAAVTPEESEQLGGCEVLFSAGSRQRLFTAAEFVLSFSVPNLHFHAATAYDILRLKGVPLHKLDYLGPLRGRAPA